MLLLPMEFARIPIHKMKMQNTRTLRYLEIICRSLTKYRKDRHPLILNTYKVYGYGYGFVAVKQTTQSAAVKESRIFD